MKVRSFTNIDITENDQLKNFTFENMEIEAQNTAFDSAVFDGLVLKNVKVNGKLIENN